MKKLLASLLLLSLLLCSCSGTSGKDAETTPSDGIVYEYVDGSEDIVQSVVSYEEGKEVSRDNYAYNKDGQLISITTVQNGKTVQTVSHEYSGKVLTKTVKAFTDGGISVEEITLYGEDGYIASIDYYENGEKVGRELYYHDEEGNMIRSEEVDDSGFALTYKTYEYNEDGNLSKVSYYEFDSLTLYWIYTYDIFGEIENITEHDHTGKVIAVE